MRFIDLLRATVLLSATSATVLAIVTVIRVSEDYQPVVVYGAIGWWAVATVFGAFLGRHNRTTPPIARLLATAKTSKQLPELRPGMTLVNRLWPLILATLAATIAGFFAPQVSAIGAGFAIIWALGWRHQDGAVAAIEERDGVRFYVERTSPFKPIKLSRTPGFKGPFIKFSVPSHQS